MVMSASIPQHRFRFGEELIVIKLTPMDGHPYFWSHPDMRRVGMRGKYVGFPLGGNGSVVEISDNDTGAKVGYRPDELRSILTAATDAARDDEG